MTLAELANYICTKVGQTDTASVSACKMFLRARYRMLWDGANWPEILVLKTVPFAAGVYQVMPQEIETVIRVYDPAHSIPLEAADLAQMVDLYPATFNDGSGQYMSFSVGPSVAIPYISEGTATATPGATVAVTNPEAFDCTVRVAGVGFVGGVFSPVTEVILAPAGLAGSSANYYDKVFSVGLVSPLPADGVPLLLGLTLNMKAGGAFLGTESGQILPGQTDADLFVSVRLLSAPTVAGSLFVLGKRRRNDLLSDGDAPIIRGCDNALIAFAQADMLERDRQYAKAQAKISDGQKELQGLVDLKRQQSASQTRIVPVDIHGAGYSDGGFSDKTHW